ncbi:sensor histidine kinase YesM [Aquimarina sp. EL_43]|uniref:sensor histidine kinase n=1 Tax=Aquimarina TaxID=290174 RepID=UPI000471C69C|nr:MULTISPECIES: histidine kinase [Aquimarina]MBG6130968.1 sensor histidine kinase YesM [Aquimarina sp. EL_35]MBG6151427.1 sensor histidine kinase YesM [Aquimarina sp. EL_32]MBG6169358.1 sensor histidine kinase YesM [Aquimarina sp. EL_43]
MNTLKISKKNWFWILQLLGWGIPGCLIVYTKFNYEKTLSQTYIVSEAVLFTSAGILFSSFLWLLIRNKIFIETISIKIVIRILLIYLLMCLAMTIFVEVLVYLLYVNIENKELDRSFNDYILNFINISVILFFWLILYFSINSILRAQKGKVEGLQLKSILRESQLNTLKGQINPHFMFNSLNNIRALMLEDVNKSREMITKLSELLRYSLNSNKVDKITLGEEIEVVNNYIELSKIQLEKRLRYHEEIEAGILDIKIPPMLIQMLVENAIKHGISNQIGGGVVSLKIRTGNNDLQIEVYNTGMLKESRSTTKIGLQNISERLRLLYGTTSSFELKEEDQEVVARIKIPLDE